MMTDALGSLQEGSLILLPADGVAAILEGSAEVIRNGRTLATLGPGSVLGELSILVPSASRTATARANSRCG